MSKQTKSTLVPKLRFPEFRGAEGWQEKILSDACEMQAGKFVAASNISEHNENGYFPCYGGNGLRGYTRTYTHEGTYSLIGRQGALCGNVRRASGKFHATEHAVVATQKQSIDAGWLYYSLDLLNLNRFATGQAQPGLSVDVLENVPLAIPKQKTEQRKIASCLSSVDELIAAQARKLDALKTHKKGLMQNLFPREGETQPRLRFPGFKNDGEWKLRKIGDMLSETQRPIELADDVEYRLVTVKRRYGGLVSRGIMKGREILVKTQFLVKTGDFLISKRQIVHNACGLVTKELDGAVVSNEYSVLTPKPECSIEFLAWFAMQPSVSASFMNCSVGIVIEKMLFKLPAWLKEEFRFPKLHEQHRIASCLTALDDLIAAQTQKLEALITNKKGLMQQLFLASDGE